MHIGIDFDNTLVGYDALFRKVAGEWGVVPDDLRPTKLAVRDWLRAAGQEDRWTEMQGHVYGARMDEATAYPGAIEFILAMLGRGYTVSIVSHKTRHPFMGPKHDLHVAARGWIAHHLQPQLDAAGVAIGVFFELTKGEKLARIGQCGCDSFIDDLPEILLAPEFPSATRALLFDPECMHVPATLTRFVSWVSLSEFFKRQ
jgi:hypothetical protein